jgi:hypothetical protein
VGGLIVAHKHTTHPLKNKKFGHTFIVAITVYSDCHDPHALPIEELAGALGNRIGSILCKTEDGLPGDGRDAFQHCGTDGLDEKP